MSRAGFTLIELLIVVSLIGVIVGIAVPGFIHARILGRETAAIVSLHAVNSAQKSYSSVCGRDAYAVLLPTLAVPPSGSSTGFLSPDLTGGEAPVKSGYHYTLVAGAEGMPGPADCNGSPTHTTYYASASPVSVGRSGTRAFATNQDGNVWQDTSGVAPTEPFTSGATVSPVPASGR